MIGVLKSDKEAPPYASFIGFLERLLIQQYPTGRVVLVMDNASYHKSAPALAALSLFEHRVMVIWLPTYCSDLNPIEVVFLFHSPLHFLTIYCN